MPDKDFFIGEWKVWEQDKNNLNHPVKTEQTFRIVDEGGDEVCFQFQIGFGDGCWNQHIQNGHFADGSITAPIVDDGICKPAPKTDTFLVEEDGVVYANSTKKRIRCKVFANPSLEPTFLPVEQGGEFGAEDI